jgi:hypothetical protein
MLTLLTLLIMAAVAYAFFREGVLTAWTMTCNVLLAGLAAFNCWEPLAGALEPLFQGTFLAGYEDCVSLTVLFSLTLGVLRLVTNNLANAQVEHHPFVQQGGSALLGLVTGYLVSGFLLCVLQTLPWGERFMNFDLTVDPHDKVRRVLPADRVWLALMHRASVGPFAHGDSAFDADGSFEQRYARLRRYKEGAK